MTTPAEDSSRGDRFETLPADYLRRADAGETVDRAAFVAANPDPAGDLESFWAVERGLRRGRGETRTVAVEFPRQTLRVE